MAFWGVEVKPGKPFKHSFDRVRGRLHISQATLGIGSSEYKRLVQCTVGDRSPVFLCALLPYVTESCHLNLEFEEDDEVLFSVIGNGSVHLTGYYLGNVRHSNINDDTDSHGKDIANTDTGPSKDPSAPWIFTRSDYDTIIGGIQRIENRQTAHEEYLQQIMAGMGIHSPLPSPQ